jgi:hypothetical protein
MDEARLSLLYLYELKASGQKPEGCSNKNVKSLGNG